MKYIKSACIGYWRMGASFSMISAITGLSKNEVENIINEYSFNILKDINK